MLTIVDRDHTGTVIIRDAREDGSYVLLVCRRPNGGGEGGNIAALPDKEEIFPTGRVQAEVDAFGARVDKKPFKLEIDISQMPRGELRFRNDTFIKAVLDESESGKVAITLENARRWGYIGRGRDDG